jgi:hypothetical protein
MATAIGWKLDPAARAALLARFPPRYAATVADHVTLAAGVSAEVPLPPSCAAEVIGRVDDDEGVEALIAEIDGTSLRPDGGTFHLTWSLAPGRKAAESNDVIARLGWTPLPERQPAAVHPARF